MARTTGACWWACRCRRARCAPSPPSCARSATRTRTRLATRRTACSWFEKTALTARRASRADREFACFPATAHCVRWSLFSQAPDETASRRSRLGGEHLFSGTGGETDADALRTAARGQHLPLDRPVLDAARQPGCRRLHGAIP